MQSDSLLGPELGSDILVLCVDESNHDGPGRKLFYVFSNRNIGKFLRSNIKGGFDFENYNCIYSFGLRNYPRKW